jgi:hypothetical protein
MESWGVGETQGVADPQKMKITYPRVHVENVQDLNQTQQNAYIFFTVHI